MTETRFNPRDFISPPYKTCPKCGHETLGVLTISGNSNSRLCRDCWDMVNRFALPKLHKKIIYLDQYVVSNLMKLRIAARPIWIAWSQETFTLRLPHLLMKGERILTNRELLDYSPSYGS
ncbi:hypothetical protein EDE15_4987 [Edaphobacter aggregans]|jgi:hypothetical protein|uniref:Uncharacterized protein n=1 Tax=Edaphobacter aggregans TaxID=570835 RepID=A0A3R9PDL2_9BACT|nr:hypothetical protein EDE15_4987 [Edaphobacter aggregans]